MNTDAEASNAKSRRGRSSAIRVAKWLIAAAVIAGLYFAVRAASSQWNEQNEQLRNRIAEIDRQLRLDLDPQRQSELRATRAQLESTIPRLSNLRWPLLVMAAALYALGLLPSAFLLRRAALTLGTSISRGTAVAAQLLGHVGKYVPGKAMVVVLRAGAMRRDGASTLPATLSIFLETFLMMAVGAAVAGVVTWWLPVPRWIAFTALAIAVLASLPTLPPILKRVAARVTSTRLEEIDSKIGIRLFVAGWGWSLLTWLLIGGSFTALVAAIPSSTPLPSTPLLYAISTAAISLAMVVGFASLLPGGAGIRELVLTTVLGVAIGSVHGLLAAIAARILFLIVEAILAAASWAWLRADR